MSSLCSMFKCKFLTRCYQLEPSQFFITIWFIYNYPMFIIKNRALTQAVRTSRNLFKNDTKKSQTEPQPPRPETQTQKAADNTGFVMASEDLSKPFPYKFGGVTRTKTSDSRIQSFMPLNRPNFFQMYLQLLKAVQKKNQKLLSTLVNPDLLEPLLSRNVRLINEDSSGIFQYNTFASGLGIQGPRNDNFRINNLNPGAERAKQLGQSIKIYMPQSPMSMLQMFNNSTSSNFPIMVSAEITIKSKACLIQPDTPQRQKQQTHILTFQRQAELNVSTAMSMMSGLKMAMGGSISSDKMRNLLYEVDRPWKIANIDHFTKDRWEP